jgi:hypothetical protein
MIQLFSVLKVRLKIVDTSSHLLQRQRLDNALTQRLGKDFEVVNAFDQRYDFTFRLGRYSTTL